MTESVNEAWHNLERAIREMTDCLEYDWQSEWRPEIEALNTAYIRYQAAKQRDKIK